MSQSALALAVRDTLQPVFTLDNAPLTGDSCEVGFPPGKPKPGCGQLYIAVWPDYWKDMSDDFDLHEEFGINVTITLRMGVAPFDRWGIAVWAAQQSGLHSLCRKALVAIHQNQLLRKAANVYLAAEYGATPDGLYMPLWFRGGGRPEPKGPDWFGAAVPDTDEYGNFVTPVECGVAQTLSFGKARRSQTLAGME